MGIYQLTAPVISMAFSLCCAGFQTALSRYVAAKCEDDKSSLRFLLTGISITTVLSSLLSVGIYSFSDFLSEFVLSDINASTPSFPICAILPKSILCPSIGV